MKSVTDYQEVLDAIAAGHNVFVTGSAGSGKTHLISETFAKSTKKSVALTATTGIAALNLGGETIHRFLKIGISCRPFEIGKAIGTWDKISTSSAPWDKASWNLIQSIDAIIIDEVSMLRRDQFELIEAVLSSIRDNTLPFGGVQIILVGDFFQLPPVVSDHDLSRYSDLSEPFCFQSDIWRQANFQSFNLSNNYRQGEGDFLQALEKIRIGSVDDDTNKMFLDRLDAKLNTHLQPVKLFPHKVSVRDENLKCLKQLPGDKILSTAEYFGKKYHVDILKKECPAADKLFFCIDAQVMMLTNDPEGRWVNGTMGTIESINPIKIRLSNNNVVGVDLHTWERVEHTVKNGRVETKQVASVRQFPFKLAYASTIHKSQGLTLDFVDIDLSKCFTYGQAYVALSRARQLGGLTLRGWNKKSVLTNPDVLKFYQVR